MRICNKNHHFRYNVLRTKHLIVLARPKVRYRSDKLRRGCSFFCRR